MHDCQRTKARLVDLCFDEASDTDALRAEVEVCPDCRTELRALESTMRAYECANDSAQPTEDAWAGYHARLAARMHALELESDSTRSSHTSVATSTERHATSTQRSTFSPARLSASTARRSSFASRLAFALTATWRVPAPVAIAVALILACLSVYALRPAPAPVAVDAPAARFDLPATQVLRVEVPVVRERVVTRTIYVPRAEGLRSDLAARVARDEMARGVARVRDFGESVVPAANTLVGFRPAADVRLRVIKGNYTNEK